LPGGWPCNPMYLAECGARCSSVGKVVEACGVYGSWFANYSVCKCSDKYECPKYPGDDPTKAPPGTEWRGQPGSTPGSKEGAYYNPKTRESFHPDLQHGGKIPPHWDYRDPSGAFHRLFPGNIAVPR
jgi:hypothetical protein